MSTFTCPRCRAEVEARFYGPCDECREVLRTAMGGAARVVDIGAYEPKVNVTPNQVATKD